ncbi:hypothetical protein HBB16_14315, partial [Pseudonocardia sp. MCCB 268]|nr:hypothetical protein [Pseudonocardia cytotoxica]
MGTDRAVLASSHRVALLGHAGYGVTWKSAEVSLGVQAGCLRRCTDGWRLDTRRTSSRTDHGGAVTCGRTWYGAAYASLTSRRRAGPVGPESSWLVRENAAAFAALPDPLSHEALVWAYIRGRRSGLVARTTRTCRPGCGWGRPGRRAFYRQIAQADSALQHRRDRARYGEPRPARRRIVWGTEDTWIPVDGPTGSRRRSRGRLQVLSIPFVVVCLTLAIRNRTKHT